MDYKYKVFSPSGNDTALVMKKISSKEDKKIINDIIMRKHSNVEQVGFMYMENGIPSLEMAGGEFCGNASRCMTYEFLKGKEGTIDIKASGTYNVIKAGIDKDNNAWCEIPLKNPSIKNIIEIVNDNVSIVTLSGIVHVIKTDYDSTLSSDELKKEALKVLEEHNLMKSKLAAGVMFVDLKEKIKINPVVWVAEIDTLFFENACGTGTVAVGIDRAIRGNKNIDTQIYQPSGESINCSVQFIENDMVCGIIGGKIKELYEGCLRHNDFK